MVYKVSQMFYVSGSRWHTVECSRLPCWCALCGNLLAFRSSDGSWSPEQNESKCSGHFSIFRINFPYTPRFWSQMLTIFSLSINKLFLGKYQGWRYKYVSVVDCSQNSWVYSDPHTHSKEPAMGLV
jgi:hypothetical protein